MRYIIIVGDGMADRPLKELGGKTPLEAASTPNMDYIARMGRCGMVNHFYKGLPLDSGVANLSILGYDPKKYYPGRGPLEAVNIGVSLEPGDIAMRFNFVTVKNDRLEDPFSGHITNAETRELVQALRKMLEQDGMEFYQGVSYRNLLVLRAGRKYSLDIKCSLPHDIRGENVSKHMVKATSEKGKPMAKLLNDIMRQSRELLENHPINKKRVSEGKNPANMIWVWGAGMKARIPSFREKYGLDGSLISAVDLLKGIGREIGLEVIDVPGATGYLDTNYEGKADAALKSIQTKDFSFIHIESTDEAGHEGILKNKINAIEDLDKRVVGRILNGIKDDCRIAVTADHPTPLELKVHSDESVPFAILDTREKMGDGAGGYNEREIREKGSLGSIKGYDFMRLLVKGL